MPEPRAQHKQAERRLVLLAPSKRDAMPQNVPFGQMLSYGPNSSPTITITKTLFSAAEVTRTRTDSSSSKVASDSTGSTVIATTTEFSKSAQTDSTAAVFGTAASGNPPAQQPGVVAGSVIGSMAAFGMIGILIWYFYIKKQGKQKLKVKLNPRRRKSSDVKASQFEQQSLEMTRAILLQQAKLNKSGANDLYSSFAPSAEASEDPHYSRSQEQHNNDRSNGSQIKTPETQPSWIGLAMSTTTPPNTPPLPKSKSKSQNGTAQSADGPRSHPPALTPGSRALRTSTFPSLMPTPLKPAMKPAPIITSPRLDRLSNLSPLSPRGMFNAMSNTTKGAWRRASQALSPSSYQRLKNDGPAGAEFLRIERRPTLPRNPELDIGAQTDKSWDKNWI